jgi:pimeloyl-ACP methyl ester carboxylesterase
VSEVDPLSALVEFSRALLLTAGLARCESSGTVYFSGGGQAGSPVLVLIHGVNDHAGSWGAVATPLARHSRLIIPDLPGHGESGPATGPVGLPLMVEKLHAVIDAEGANRVILAGNSMGAWISILYALQHPERVEHLILESGGGLALPPGVPMVANNRDEAARILRAVHGPDYPTPHWLTDGLIARSATAPVHRVLASNVFPHFVDERLKELNVPVTIVWGDQDGVVYRSYVEKLQEGIAGSKLVVIPNAGHIPHAQQPERFVEIFRCVR